MVCRNILMNQYEHKGTVKIVDRFVAELKLISIFFSSNDFYPWFLINVQIFLLYLCRNSNCFSNCPLRIYDSSNASNTFFNSI